MTDTVDQLSPEVRGAVRMLDESHGVRFTYPSEWGTVRAELLRLLDENRALRILVKLLSKHDAFIHEVEEARKVWLDENDPKDGTDCVTPFDKFLYNPTRGIDHVR